MHHMTNMAKGTMDPRVDFCFPMKLLYVISQVPTQILIKFHLHNLDQASTSKYQPNISQNLDQTKLPFYFALVFYMHLVSFKLCVICFRTSLFLDAFAAWTNKTYFAILKKSDPLNILSGRFTASNGGSFQDIQFIWQFITLKSWELRPNLT